MRAKTWLSVTALLLGAWAATTPSVVSAVPLEIVATPQETSGPFRHNVFHTAHRAGGAGGSILAWFDLDTSMSSFYDPDTGELEIHVNLFEDSGFNTIIGTAVGTSNAGDLLGGAFNDFDDSSLGFISWSFDAAVQAALGLGPSADLQFIDHDYVTSEAGLVANSYDGTFMTLWGADGSHIANSGRFDGSTLGMDLVFQVTVPEPGIVLLMGLGLLGLGWTHRPRR